MKNRAARNFWWMMLSALITSVWWAGPVFAKATNGVTWVATGVVSGAVLIVAMIAIGEKAYYGDK